MKAKRFIEGAVIGAIAGAIGGILFAPKKGKETRDDLAKAFSDIKKKVVAELHKMNDFTKDSYNAAVKKAISGYKKVKKILPEDAAKINDIFTRSFADINKVVKKDLGSLKKPVKKTAAKKS